MNEIIDFLNSYYKKAIELSNAFRKTRDFEWTPLLILNELSVQIGHVYNIIYHNDTVDEKGRNFTDLGDELSDILLQLLTLANSLKINVFRIKHLGNEKEENWFAIPILLGQLNEAIMEKYGYRFKKPREGFKTIESFIENRIFKLISISYHITVKYNLNMKKEFAKMLEDAYSFLDKQNNKTNANIDIEHLKAYSYRNTEEQERDLQKYKTRFKEEHLLEFMQNYIFETKEYEIYFCISNEKTKVNNLLLRKTKNKILANLYFNHLINKIEKKNLNWIVQFIEKKQ